MHARTLGRSGRGKGTTGNIQLRLDALEPRIMLSLAIWNPVPESPLRGLVENLFSQVEAVLPQEVRDTMDPIFNLILDTGGSTYSYQAFPGEVNDVKVWGDLANMLLMTGESKDVTIWRAGTFNFEPIEQMGINLLGKFHIGASFIGEIAGGLGLQINKLDELIFKQIVSLSEPRVIALNGWALANLFPEFGDVIEAFDTFKDFSISDLIPEEITLIPPIKLPGFLGGGTIFPGITLSMPEWMQQFPTIGDVVGYALPQPLVDVLGWVDQAVDWLQQSFQTDGVYISTLDGNDRIDLSALTGLPQTVHGDLGNDTILAGGGQDLLDTWGIRLGSDGPDDRPIILYGDDGNDTFIVNRNFNSRDTTIYGGDGSDRLVIQGSDAADVIRLIAGPDGKLAEIRFEIPNALSGSPRDELQRITLPGGTDGGTFVLQGAGWANDTGPIPWNATADMLRAALVAAGGVPINSFNVTKNPDNTWDVEFVNDLGATDFVLLVGNGGGLTRTIDAVLVSTDREGGNGGATPIANEIQEISLPDEVTGGTFTLQFDTYPVTDAISFSAGTRDVEYALLQTGLPRNDFEVTGTYGGPWRIEFTGNRALTNVPDIVVDASELTGLMADWDLLTIQDGVDAVNAAFLVGIPQEADGGTFDLTVNIASDARTIAVAYNVTAVELEQQIEGLGTVGDNNVWVTQESAGVFRVEFINDLEGESQVSLAADSTNLTGIAVTEDTAGGGGTDEIQEIELAEDAQGGSFTLTFGGDTTGLISAAATAGEVDTAFEALASIGVGNVDVTGPAGGPWLVEFTGGGLEDTDQPLIEAAPYVDVSVETNGDAGTNEIQHLIVPAAATGGNLRLLVTTPWGLNAAQVDYDTDATGLQDALEALGVVGEGNVQVTEQPDGSFHIEFIEDLASTAIDPITVDTRFLAGGGTVTIREFSPLIVNEIQNVSIPNPDAVTGTFQLEVTGYGTTGNIDFGASAEDVEAALEAVVGAGNVSVTGAARAWEVEFTGALEGTDMDEMIVQNGQSDITGGVIQVDEIVAGNDGEETTVLATTAFTDMTSVEMFEIQGGAGDDTLILDTTEGPIYFEDGLYFTGGSGLNRLILEPSGDTPARATYSEHKSGRIITSFGADPEDVQLVRYSSARILDFVPADELRARGSSDGDTISLQQDEYEGNPVGLIRLSNGPSWLYYSGKDEVQILGRGGDDAITVNMGDLEAGVLSLLIDAGPSAAGDVVLINGTDLDDVFDYTPTSMKGGTMDVTIGGRAVDVELAGIESFSINAWEQDPLADTLVVRAAEADVDPGAFPGTGLVTPRSAAGLARLAVDYANMEDVDLLVLDILAFEGSVGDDVVEVTPSQVVFVDIFGHRNVTDVAGVDIVWLHLMGSNDTVTVTATTQLPFQLEILGGSSDPGGDIMSFTGSGGALVMDLDDGSLVDAAGSRVTYWGVEGFAIDTAGGTLAIVTSEDDETLTVTPLDSDTGRLVLEGTTLEIGYSGVAGQPVALDLGAGQDTLVVVGSSAGDEVTVSLTEITFTDDGRSLSYAGAEALSIQGLYGNDRLDVDNTAGLVALPGGINYDGGPGIDTLRLLGSTVVDASVYEVGPAAGAGIVIHTLGDEEQVVLFTGLEPVIDTVAGPLVVNGTGASNMINFDVGPNSGTALVGGQTSAQVSVDGFEPLEFTGKTSLTINGLAGHDTIDLNNAPLPAGLVSVTIDGGSGDDILIGSAGDDLILGGRGDDVLRGEGGDDILDGGAGNNDLDGGPGGDTAEFYMTDDADTAEAAPWLVTVNGEESAMTAFEFLLMYAMAGGDYVTVDASDGIVASITIMGGPGDDVFVVTLANPAPSTWITLDGDDHVNGDSATVKGEFGDDQFTVYGDTNVFGQAQVDLVEIENPEVLEGRRLDSANRKTAAANKWGFIDADGNNTRVDLSGGGIADVYRNIYSGRNADIHSIVFIGTRPGSTKLKVTVARADGTDNETSIGWISGSGVRLIDARLSDLTGDLSLEDGLGSLLIDDIADGVELVVGGPSAKKLSIVADEVGDVDLITTTYLHKLTVTWWEDGLVKAAVIGSVQTTAGGFGADVVNTRANYHEYGIYSVSVRGGDLVTSITTDRIRSIQVRDGDADLVVIVTTEGAAMRNGLAVGDVSISSGNLLGATFAIHDQAQVGKLSVRGRKGVGGHVTGPVTVTGGVVRADIGGNLLALLQIDANLGSLSMKGGDILADVDVGGGLGKLLLKGSKAGGGWLRAGRNVYVGGLLGSAKISAYETDNGGDEFGIYAGAFGKLGIGANKLGPTDLPFTEGDFAVRVI